MFKISLLTILLTISFSDNLFAQNIEDKGCAYAAQEIIDQGPDCSKVKLCSAMVVCDFADQTKPAFATSVACNVSKETGKCPESPSSCSLGDQRRQAQATQMFMITMQMNNVVTKIMNENSYNKNGGYGYGSTQGYGGYNGMGYGVGIETGEGMYPNGTPSSPQGSGSTR
jgi:hypothetical protein